MGVAGVGSVDRQMKKRKIVGIGELLWDLLPAGASLGGAPANFAYVAGLLGDHGIVASRVGPDLLGRQAVECMRKLGLCTDYVQIDSQRPTGTVKVAIDANGQAAFEIANPVAWDFLEWTPAWRRLAEEADVVCFGSLAQRSPQSRAAIRTFVNALSADAITVFDVNLRQSYFSREILADSMKLADVVKVNHDELPRIMALNGLPHNDERLSAEILLAEFAIKLFCITRGSHGSVLVQRDSFVEHPGFRVKVADTVGSGDAFTAALLHEYLRGSSLHAMNEMANRVGAWVASKPGGMPVADSELYESLGGMTLTD
jgi:fructokinase